MANLNLKTHPLKDSPKPGSRPQHAADTYKAPLFKGTGKLAKRHRSHVFGLRAFQPLHDRVLVKRIEEKPHGLIIIPDAHKEQSREVEIIALGPKAKWGYQVGDVVLVSPSINMDYSDLIDDNGDYVLIQQADILCIVER